VETTIRAMPRIVLEGVLKSFAGADGKSVKAVVDLSLAVPDRELLALVGPSGCGKTTTLRLIAGLETPDAGKILFDDKLVTTLPPLGRDVAMVFQSHALFPHLSAFNNLALGLELRHVPRAEIFSRVREIAAMLGITYCLERKPGKLSGGERQRIALGRALVRRPRILLLDEPFSHLDEPLRVQMRAELLALRSRLEMTVIYVTHDQAEALALGDRVAVLRTGQLQQVGAPREIYNAPANTFVAGFIGAPPMNLFHGTVMQREEQLVLVGAKTAPDAPSPALVVPLGGWRADWFAQNVGRQVLLGIRPEGIGVTDSAAHAHASQTIAAVVQSIQYLGAESILHLTVGKHEVVARTASAGGLQRGQTVALAFDLRQAHVYDAATGALLW
jgi:multiple sugar transport system ATP-binding protein